MRAVASLFAPYRTPLFFAQLVFLVKHSPVWALPILTADLINAISSEERASPHRLVVDAVVVGIGVNVNGADGVVWHLDHRPLTEGLPPGHESAMVLTKPYDPTELIESLSILCGPR